MHDDIEDQDNLRRGSLTIHKQYENEHRKNFLFKKNAGHFGISMGINLGDLGAYLGMEALLHSKLPDKNKLAAATYLSRLLQHVAYGQSLDNLYEQKENITQKDVLDVHLHKTGIYTVTGPLKIGALLGGAKEGVLDAIDKYGDKVGIAFQLRDDELGLFSSEEELGKPIGGDIKEGKNTLLKVKALELSNSAEREFLKSMYGKANITKKQVTRVREITIKSGALEYSQKLSKKLVEEGKRYIPKITKEKKYQQMLTQMADFMIERKS
jgi:geranylgeranyl diphosphate synthase type I